MAATAYLVTPAAGSRAVDGVENLVVCANSTAEAKLMAASYSDHDSDARWSNATVTSINTDPNDFENFVLRVIATDPVTPFTVIDKSVTGTAAESFATLIGRLATELNTTAIDGAAFGTDTLKVAETTDGMGDWDVQFFFTAPNGADLTDLYLSAITDGGSSGAALTVALIASGTLSRTVSPKVYATYK